MKTQSIKQIALIVLGILLIPLVAMQFSEEVNWSVMDFIVAGVILFAAGFALAFIRNNIKHPKKRLLIIILICLLVAVLWAELAVGIFESPLAGS